MLSERHYSREEREWNLSMGHPRKCLHLSSVMDGNWKLERGESERARGHVN